MHENRRKYALVGTGGRAVMYIEALAGSYAKVGELVGLCDVSKVRMAYYNRRLKEQFQHPQVAEFHADAFDEMIAQTRPDVVIVTTVDALHHKYIIRAMELGCDVICEKPMTVDEQKAQAVLDAIDRTGRTLRVTFNYRYAPECSRMRQLVSDGVVGKPLAVDFSWVLDTSHGADYFRRWHAEKQNSGGLLVHKATHHFDLINWWIDGRPETVFAMGDLKFYGRRNAAARGKTYGYDRYTGHAEAQNDPFALRLDEDETLRTLYMNAEEESGYVRDRNVFADHITIEDTMAVMCRYDNGVILNYSLLAYSPWEGFRVAITGTEGRLEMLVKHGSHVITGQSDDELAAEQAKGALEQITLYPMFGLPRDVPVEKAEGGHGGGDPVILEQLFSPDPPADPLRRAADHVDGAASILIGISANHAMRTGSPVRCDSLLKLERSGAAVSG
jgi:predicted dehydrogenase